MSNPFKGAFYFLTGLKLIFKPGIRAYVVMPLLINTLLFAALIWFGAQQFGVFLDWLIPELPEWLQWLSWILWVFFVIAGLLILFFTFSLLANLVGAPFNGLLAEAVESHLTGQKPQGDSSGNFFANIVPLYRQRIEKNRLFSNMGYPFIDSFPHPRR